ncbi:ParE family toxin-like protein [Candidatus Fervidibacter sacchari]
MKHKATPRFWECYRQLPQGVKKLADKCFELLKQEPQHPSLHLKKVGRFWSVRIGKRYRALAVEHEGELLWFWIGSHDDYEKLLKRQ